LPFCRACDARSPPSFPTRRSSDVRARVRQCSRGREWDDAVMTVEPRRPRLVQTSGHTYEWVWPSDPANLAEDERIAEVYHQERMRERAEYAKRREEYLKQVEAERRARELALCLNCHEPVFNGSLYCSRTCEYAARC